MSQTGTAAISPPERKKPAKSAKARGELLLDTFGLTPDSMGPLERRSAISGYDLKHRIEAMVAGIAKKKIKHIYKGDGAATAPGIMILPRIVATSLFPMRHVRILLGYAAHEISHQLKTDFKLLEKLVTDTTMDKRKKQQVKEFWNAIEDYRIEKLVKADYPGFHVYIDDTRDFSAKRFCERVDAGLYGEKDLGNPYRLGSVALTWIGAELNGYVTRAPRAALGRLTAEHLAWVESWASEMAQVKTCKQALDLAVRIVEDLDTARSQPEEDESDTSSPKHDGSSGQTGGTSCGQQGDDQTSSGNKGQEQEKEPADGKDGAGDPTSDEKSGDDTPEEGDGGATASESEEEKGGEDSTPGSGAQEDDGEEEDGGDRAEGTDGDDDGAQGGSSQAGGSGRPRPPVKDGDEQSAAEQADLEIDDLAAAINSMKGAEAQQPHVEDEDDIAGCGIVDEKHRMEAVAQGQAAYSALRREVGPAAGRAAGILRRLLQSTARRTWHGGKEEGELDFSRIVGMTRGDPDIYRQREVRNSVNTAVSLLLDNSGSMSGHPIRMCQETAVTLDMAIQGTKTNVEITGFTGSAGHPVLYRYRAFGQKGQAASASLGNMDQVSLGGTPVSTPLLEAWRRLSQQKEPRRILIVVSDGGADYNDVQAARAAHDFIVRQGCAILGIAIGEDKSMCNWCDNVQHVKLIDDLPVALTNLVREALK